MNELDEFTKRLRVDFLNIPETFSDSIYHYTSITNLNSILGENGEVVLWASRYDCLNDVSEGTLPEIRYKEVCCNMLNDEKITKEFYEMIQNVKPARTILFLPVKNDVIRPIRDEYDTYLISFSKSNDLLAMWNYYSKGNKYEGVNVGVSAANLSKLSNLHMDNTDKFSMKVFEVVYDEDEQRKLISDFLEELVSKYRSGAEKSVRYHISNMLSKLNLVFKNKCFEHEQEVRFTIQISKKYRNVIPVYYRTYSGYLIPYIKIKFDKRVVEEVTLGPLLGDEKQKELQLTVLHEMLFDKGYSVKETCSKIPVRY